jgi:hypothetical protein
MNQSRYERQAEACALPNYGPPTHLFVIRWDDTNPSNPVNQEPGHIEPSYHHDAYWGEAGCNEPRCPKYRGHNESS